MTHRHDHGLGLGLLAVAAMIAYVFGERGSRIFAGAILLLVIPPALFFLYVCYRVVKGTV